MTMLAPSIQPVTACRAYLKATLAASGISLSVGATPPDGKPTAYALLNQVDSVPRGFVADYLLRVRVFNRDAYECGQHALLLHAALLGAAGYQIIVPGVGELWVNGTTHQAGPSDLDDPDVALFGQAMAVFWTVSLKPIEGVKIP